MAVDHRWSGRYEEDDRLVEQVPAVEAQEYVPLKTKHTPGPVAAELVAVKEPISILEQAKRVIKKKRR